MTVEVDEYVLIGVDVGYKWVDDHGGYDANEQYMIRKPKPGDITMVYDSMCGKFCFIGKVVSYVERYENESENVSIDVNYLQDEIKAVSEVLNNVFSVTEQPKLHIVFQYY